MVPKQPKPSLRAPHPAIKVLNNLFICISCLVAKENAMRCKLFSKTCLSDYDNNLNLHGCPLLLRIYCKHSRRSH